MTRKRYIKLLMGQGMSRNEAAEAALYDRLAELPYAVGWMYQSSKRREELRYLKRGSMENYDSAFLKEIIRTIDAMFEDIDARLANLKSQQKSAMPGSHPDTAQKK